MFEFITNDRYRGTFDEYVKGEAINHKGGYIHSSWTYIPALYNDCISLLTILEYHKILTFTFTVAQLVSTKVNVFLRLVYSMVYDS